MKETIVNALEGEFKEQTNKYEPKTRHGNETIKNNHLITTVDIVDLITIHHHSIHINIYIINIVLL